jgi:hypothetical protein
LSEETYCTAVGKRRIDCPGEVCPSWERCSERVIREWTAFLGKFDFNIFDTITFAQAASSGQLALDRSVRVLRKFGFRGFCCAEPHKLGGYHTHSLLAVPPGLATPALCTQLYKVVFKQYGRCRFELMRDVGGVHGYVSKYVVKNCGDWCIFDGAAQRPRRSRWQVRGGTERLATSTFDATTALDRR